MKANIDGSIAQTLRKDINEFENFVMFLRKDKKNIHQVHLKTDKWCYKKTSEFDMDSMIDLWNNSDRFKHLSSL